MYLKILQSTKKDRVSAMYLYGDDFDAVYEIQPAYAEKNVAIVFETSELFVPYLNVALLSLLDNIDSSNNYDILILSCELKQYVEDELETLVENRPNVTLRVINPHSMVERYIEKAHYHYLEINYYRLMLPWILKNYDKAINLGADIIIRHDVATLAGIEMENDCYLAGAPDLGYHGRLSIDISPDELGMKNPYMYVNADVLLFNLKAIRENINKNTLMNLWQKKQFMCAEQDVLNLAFDGHVKLLDLRWNVYPERMTSEYHIEHAPESSIATWKNSLNDPYIIHYAAVPKPWDYPMVGFGDVWWSYARRTPYYEEIIRRMCITAYKNEGIIPQSIGLKGALIIYVKKHCPKVLRPLAVSIKKLLRW